MENRRVTRVEREIQHAMAEMLIHGLKIPLPGFASVLEVKASPDLRQAKVYIRVAGSKANQAEAAELLERQHGHIQREINAHLKIKYCPVLRFIVGGVSEEGEIDEIEMMLANLHRHT